jgi:anti-sigma factor RsiW
MTARECAAARDAAPELALDLLDGADRAAVLEHVHRCPACQSEVAELAGVADLLVQLAPEAEPPAGFGRRVVGATRRDRRARRRAVTALVAVAAAATIGAVAVVRVVDAGRSDVERAAPELRSAPMQTPAGIRVGRVVATAGTPAGVAVTVDYAVPDGEYELVLRRSGGSTVVGSMTVSDGRGSWTGPVERRAGDSVLEMVDGINAVVCRGAFPS